jgi:hypothetical protein
VLAPRWLAAVVAFALLGAACGDDDDRGDAVLPAVDQIAPAIAAVEAELGGPQEYFEVNATGATVNLFVADGAAAQVTAYSYLSGALLPPDSAQPASGATFAADALTFDPDTIFDQLLDELDDPVVARFVVVGGPDGAVQYAATVQSEQGGTLDVLLGPDGTVQSVDPGTTGG